MNRAHWPIKENMQTFGIFVLIFWPMGKWLGMVLYGTRRISLLIQTLPPFLAERIWILIFSLDFGTRIFGFPGSQISKFPDFPGGARAAASLRHVYPLGWGVWAVEGSYLCLLPLVPSCKIAAFAAG